jgi:hypothetical protein
MEEMTLGRDYVQGMPADIAWPRYAQALMVANEFVFVD